MGYPYQNANYGDYYSYQAGGIGSVLGGVAAIAGKVLPGPLGVAASAAAAALKPKTTAVVKAGGGPQQLPQVPTPGFIGAVQRAIPGGATGMQTVGAQCALPMRWRGYHVNKALMRYALALERGANVTDPRSRPRVVNECVRNRSLNPTNPHALRRAIRRTGAFVALARASLKGSGYTIKRTGLPRTAKRRVRRK